MSRPFGLKKILTCQATNARCQLWSLWRTGNTKVWNNNNYIQIYRDLYLSIDQSYKINFTSVHYHHIIEHLQLSYTLPTFLQSVYVDNGCLQQMCTIYPCVHGAAMTGIQQCIQPAQKPKACHFSLYNNDFIKRL